MRFLSTKVHGILDYLVGILLMASPWILNYSRGGAETWVPVIVGATVVMYSMMTEYELGVFKVISLEAHLALDLWSGILLAASPWLFGFFEWIYLPHLILGVLETGASLTTQRTTSLQDEQSEDHRHAH
jgi:hypothetical protein